MGINTHSVLAAPIQATYYVDPLNGNDGNNGTSQAAALKTLTKAQEQVRTLNGNMSGDIVVYLMDGLYTLSSTLTFGNSDSGTNGHSVIYQALVPYKARVSGGQKVTGWTLDTSGVYKASVGTNDFRQLYVNGRRAIRARLPNGRNKFNAMQWDGSNKRIIVDKALVGNWGNLASVEMAIMQNWDDNHVRIASITTDTANAYIKLQAADEALIFRRKYPGRLSTNVFYFENAREFITQEGQWYLNRTTGMLYYKPRTGENMSSAEVIIPRFENVIRIQGTNDSPVQNISFKGLCIEHSNWTYPNNKPYLCEQAGQYIISCDTNDHDYLAHPPAGIWVQGADNITFERNRIRFMGATGIDFYIGVSNSSIIGNTIYDIAGNGVSAGFYSESPMSKKDHYDPADPLDISENNYITNNYVSNTGADFSGCIGIAAGYCNGIHIEHNEICNAPYSGTSVGWGWKVDTIPFQPTQHANINYNKLYSVNTAVPLFDGGTMYVLGRSASASADNNMSNNYVMPAPGIKSGMYFDQGSSYYTADNNVIQGPSGKFVSNMNMCSFIDMDSTYTNRSDSPGRATNCTVTNTHHELSAPPWSAPAQAIIDNAGIEAAYRDIVTTINDNTTGTGINQFNYSAGWAYSNTVNEKDSYGRDNHYTSIGNSSVTVQFTGTQIKWYGSMDGNYGVFAASVNGGSETSVDCYAASREEQVCLYDSGSLPMGTYILKIRATGAKNANSTGAYINADRVVVLGEGGGSSIISGGIYRLTNKMSGGNLDNGNATANGANVIQWTPNANATQKWQIVEVGGGYYKLINQMSGEALDNGNTTSKGAYMMQWTDNGNTTQKWQIIDVGGGYYKLINQRSGMALDNGNTTTVGAKTMQWTDNGNITQMWLIQP